MSAALMHNSGIFVQVQNSPMEQVRIYVLDVVPEESIRLSVEHHQTKQQEKNDNESKASTIIKQNLHLRSVYQHFSN